AHNSCTQDQRKNEIKEALALTQYVFGIFDMPVDIRLSFRDDNDEKYGGDLALCERAEQEIKQVADEETLDYTIARGEASFYGPKIDFIIRDAIVRKRQLGTIQFQYVLPERCDLTYIGAHNEKPLPVIIDRAPFGSMERFMSILIEHFAGDFPLWLAPKQVSVIPVSDDQNKYAQKCADALAKHNIRAEVDSRSEKMGAKIRDAETAKVPYMFIVGSNEEEAYSVSVRRHKEGDIGEFDLSKIIDKLKTEINTKQNSN